MNKEDTIKCPCGKTDTGLNPNGFHYCPPPQGVKCPHCGQYIFPPKPIYPYPKPWKKPYDGPYEPFPPPYPWWRKPGYDMTYRPEENKIWC